MRLQFKRKNYFLAQTKEKKNSLSGPENEVILKYKYGWVRVASIIWLENGGNEEN